MMPGRMNPRQMERMMRKMGLNMEELKDVRKVVIETGSKEIVIENPAVTIMNVQGERTFQIQGKVSERSLGTEIPEEDIQLVMDQTGADRASALKALEESEGEPAEAIIKLMG